jgi:hypothetical protein
MLTQGCRWWSVVVSGATVPAHAATDRVFNMRFDVQPERVDGCIASMAAIQCICCAAWHAARTRRPCNDDANDTEPYAKCGKVLVAHSRIFESAALLPDTAPAPQSIFFSRWPCNCSALALARARGAQLPPDGPGVLHMWSHCSSSTFCDLSCMHVQAQATCVPEQTISYNSISMRQAASWQRAC